MVGPVLTSFHRSCENLVFVQLIFITVLNKFSVHYIVSKFYKTRQVNILKRLDMKTEKNNVKFLA